MKYGGGILTIGIDIDDTITYTSKYANVLLHLDKKYDYIKDYHELPCEDLKKFLEKYLVHIEESVFLKENVLEVLNYWHSKKIKIVFITARGSKTRLESINTTCVYFEKNKIPFEKIIFYQKSKYKMAMKEKVDLFIDDKECVLDEIKDVGIKTLRIWPNDIKSNHKVAHNWLEIKDYIDEMGDFNGRENY